MQNLFFPELNSRNSAGPNQRQLNMSNVILFPETQPDNVDSPHELRVETFQLDEQNVNRIDIKSISIWGHPQDQLFELNTTSEDLYGTCILGFIK